jgi:anti-sigma factor RsiW
MTEHMNAELSAYLDDELDAAARSRVEAHLTACAECRHTLEGLQRLVRRARTLDDRPPARELWSGIAARIGSADTADVVPLVPRRRRLAFSIPQLAAAAVALMVVSTGTTMLLTHRAPRSALAPDTLLTLRPAALPADGMVRSYDGAIRDLQQTLAARRSRLDTGTVRVIEQSLMVIDAAIAQARSALARDPNNLYLNSHLQRALDRKLDLLRQAATLPMAS